MKTDRRVISADAAELGEKNRKAYRAMLQQYGGSLLLRGRATCRSEKAQPRMDLGTVPK